MTSRKNEKGFTLLEIMLVVGIIVIILGVAVARLGNTTGIAKDMRVRADIGHPREKWAARSCEPTGDETAVYLRRGGRGRSIVPISETRVNITV